MWSGVDPEERVRVGEKLIPARATRSLLFFQRIATRVISDVTVVVA